MRALIAGLLLWTALLLPRRTDDLSLTTFLAIPVEALAFVTVALLVQARARQALAIGFGLLVAALVIGNALDAGMQIAFDRPFNPVYDLSYADSGWALLADSIGTWPARLTLVGITLAVFALCVVLPLAALRVADTVRRHRGATTKTVAALTAVWAAASITAPALASVAALSATADRIQQAGDAWADRAAFDRLLADDRPSTGVNALHGHDVLIVFVESYGKTALEPDADIVAQALTDADARLAHAGYQSRSGYLTSPTFGGLSWLAHASLQSGLWVDNEHRYQALLDSQRSTLAATFKAHGWRTVDVVPSNNQPWPEGKRFYGYDRIYRVGDLGYRGPTFGYATMPDQYTLAAFARAELTPGHPPVMAEIDLVSSHSPWTPRPSMVPPTRLGAGTVFATPLGQDQTETPSIRAAYLRSIAYSLTALTSFIAAHPDLVVVIVGDHQPASIASGDDTSHEVPITIVAQATDTLDRVADWGWQPGLRPADDAPVWPMDAFRDRFLDAFHTQSLGPRRAVDVVPQDRGRMAP